MSHTTDRIYVDTSVTPNIGVSIQDVRAVLGEQSTDLGTLCVSNKINMWARYKPVRTNSAIVGPITFNTRKGQNFGISIPFCPLDMMNGVVHDLYYNDEGDKWEYLKPRGDMISSGGVIEFYRLSDFVRYPGERTPSASGDPTPVNLQGYNHSANIPFTAFLNSSGVTEKLDFYGPWYEINLQTATTLVLTFYNSGGDDLHLQDFIDLNAIYSNNIAWRPVLQLFSEAGTTQWYNKSTPDMEISGPAITSLNESSWSVTLPLSSLTLNQFYHLCVGVGCCNQADPIAWKDNNNSLFIAPYTQDQMDEGKVPFYYRFKVVNYNDRKLNVLALQFFQNGTNTWVNGGGTAPYFTITSLASGYIGIQMEITRASQAVDFVANGGTAQTTGAKPMVIQAREMITGISGETIKYLQPSSGPSSWPNTTYIPVPSGTSSDKTILYATMYVGNIPVGGYGEYHMYYSVDGADFVNIGHFSIQKIQYSNS